MNRNEGLTVAELLDILEITKQSLARVLKDLVSGEFIEQRAGTEDRRQRRLHLTPRGHALAEALVGMQGGASRGPSPRPTRPPGRSSPASCLN